MTTGSPYMLKPFATTESARRQSKVRSGSDRQPSGPSCCSSDRSSDGLIRCPSSPSTCQVNTRSPTPICGAASPAPGACSIVSVRSWTSRRSSLSKSVTGTAGLRSTGSPNRRIGWMATKLLVGYDGGRARPRTGGQSTEAAGYSRPTGSTCTRRVGSFRADRIAVQLDQGAGQLGARRTGAPGARPVRLGVVRRGRASRAGRSGDRHRPEHLRPGRQGQPLRRPPRDAPRHR